MSWNGKDSLVRVIVNDTAEPAKVVTVYKTSRIKKCSRYPMKIPYDPIVDVLRIIFSPPIEESDEEKPGIILDEEGLIWPTFSRQPRFNRYSE